MYYSYKNGQGVTVSKNIGKKKVIFEWLLEDLKEVNLCKLKFHILAHMSKDLLLFGDLGLSDASLFENFNDTIKIFVRMTSLRKFTSMEKAVKEMVISVENKHQRDRNIFKNQPAWLIRDGLQIPFAGVEQCLHEIKAPLIPNGREFIFKCFIEHF